MSMCVLIVDDEADVRSIAQMGLEIGAGWNVLTASSGKEALTLAIGHQPDVILLDMMMPDMDGRATLKCLKENPSTQEIPVIFVTAAVQPSEQASFAGLDVIAIFAKPFNPLKLPHQITAAMSARPRLS
ncbi:response regulator [Desmonostoc muscorum CCALA 125]|nr:response regulator [Desmonostoc muscorum CCALA 125]